MLSAAAAEDSPFNVDVTIGWQGCFRSREWAPVEVGIAARLKKPFGGTLRLTAQQDELSQMTVSCPIVLTPDLPLQLPLAMKFDAGCDECTAEILDEDGRVRWHGAYPFNDYSRGALNPTAVDRNSLLIGTAGRAGFGLLELPKQTAPAGQGNTTPSDAAVHLKLKMPRMLPWDWTGYAGLDALILYDLDWLGLNSHQAEALVQWVSNGGRLLLVLGAHPLPAAHPLARILPCDVSQAREVVIDSQTLGRWGAYSTRGAQKLTCWLPENRSVQGLPAPDPRLFASAPVGFGRIAVIGFDPAALDTRGPHTNPAFWIEHLNPVLGVTKLRTIQEKPQNAGESYSGNSRDREQAALNDVLGHLFNIQQLRPISIWWVVSLLAVLALLLGPVDYLVLKRLDRLPLTWVTSASCILLSSVGAYYGVEAIRGGALQLRAVTVTDAIQGQPHSWSTCYSGIFAPRTEQYRLDGLDPKQWWSGVSPSSGHDSWDRPGRSTSRVLYCVQHDGGNLAAAIPISIWSMQCLVTEGPAAPPPISAVFKGDELTVVNESDLPVTGGLIRLKGNRGRQLGTLQPRERKAYAIPESGSGLRDLDDLEHTSLSQRSRSFDGRDEQRSDPRAAAFATGTWQRTEGMKSYLDQGAALVCAEFEHSPPPYSFAGRRAEHDHLRIVRLVVFREH